MTAPRFGLCDSCTHQKLIGNTRGSTFSMCLLGTTDPDWPKYPRMPVLACPRYEPRPGSAPAGDGASRVSSTARRASAS
jgi:hypothetical protein